MNPQYMNARPGFDHGRGNAPFLQAGGYLPPNVSENGIAQHSPNGLFPQQGSQPPVSSQSSPGLYYPSMPPGKQNPVQPTNIPSTGPVTNSNTNVGVMNGPTATQSAPLQPNMLYGSSQNVLPPADVMQQNSLPHNVSQAHVGVPPSFVRLPVVKPYFSLSSTSGIPTQQQLVNPMANMALGDQQSSVRPPTPHGGLPLGHVSPVVNKPPPQQASVPPYSMTSAPGDNVQYFGRQPFGTGPVTGGNRPLQLPATTGVPPLSAYPQQQGFSQGPPRQQFNASAVSSSIPGSNYPRSQMPQQNSLQSSLPPQPFGSASAYPAPESGVTSTNVPPPPMSSHGSNLPSAVSDYDQINGQSVPSYGTGVSYSLPPSANQLPGSLPNQGPMRPPSVVGAGHVPGQMPPVMPLGANQGYNRSNQGPGMMQPPQQVQQRRLDPEMMPSPIQVIEDDQRNRDGVFCTNEKGAVPPLVTTNFVTQDQGNCNPRFVRSSMYSVPNTPDMMKQSSIPFTLTISPFASLAEGEVLPPISNLGEMGPVRCVRCKAYMCPFMQFIDGGRRFQCNFCRATTDVPAEYFAHLDHTGQRIDRCERPELCLGSYEFVATKDYCKNTTFPLPPAFIFIIDVSYNNMRSGMVHLLCSRLKEVLANLPREHFSEESQVKVGFITYNTSVHFYNLKSCLAQPQVMVVPDVQEMFVPLLDGFLVGLQESESLIDSLVEQIPLLYQDCRDTETILLPAIQAGLEALKAADRSGKLFVFHTTLPIAEAPGKLKNRDDRKLLGTDKEKTILAPQTMVYNQLGKDCVAAGCSVDLFTFPNAFIDIATIGQVCRVTGGQIHKYTYFNLEMDGQRFIEDLKRSVRKQVAFDAIMRVRTSTGIRPTEFYGNYYMSNTTDVELAAVDCDKAICAEIKHDDKLTDDDAVYIQVAILYTSVGGQRRLRIHNLSLNVCAQLADLYRNCELDTIMNYYSKACLRNLCDQTPKQVKDEMIAKCATSLVCYRKNCANPSSAGQLILPECMKLLPLYVNCLLKSDAVSGGSDITVDDRSFAMHALNTMDVKASLNYIYPRLIPLHDIDPSNLSMPTALRCSVEKLKENGVYLLENGLFMFMWIGLNVDKNWLNDIFGVQSAAQIDIDKTNLLEFDNAVSQSVRHIISQIREEKQRFLKLVIVRQHDKLEMVFKHFLVEDKGMDNSPSYVDFLCHVHKEIRNLLS